MVTVHFFAAAREAAGVTQADVDAATTSALVDALSAQFGPRLAEVLAVSSLMTGGRRLTDTEDLSAGREVDVLPPFAGG